MAQAALKARQESYATLLARASAHTQLRRNRFLQVSMDPQYLTRQFIAVQNGLRIMSEAPQLREKFPFYAFKKDAYGEKYHQEAGLKHETRDGENKYVFQYIEDAYANGKGGSAEVPALREFFAAMQSLDHTARDISLALAEHLDHVLGHNRPYVGSMLRRIANGTRVTRALRYLPVTNGASDANPHIDRGVFSIHWGATHQGLWLYMPDGSRIRIDETTFGGVCLFTGRKYAAAIRDAEAGCPHGVKYERSSDADRYSLVTFVHPAIVDEDVAWLGEHDSVMKTYERSLAL